MAEAAAAGCTDAIMVGGSVGASGSILEETVRQIKSGPNYQSSYFPAVLLDFVRMQTPYFS